MCKWNIRHQAIAIQCNAMLYKTINIDSNDDGKNNNNNGYNSRCVTKFTKILIFISYFIVLGDFFSLSLSFCFCFTNFTSTLTDKPRAFHMLIINDKEKKNSVAFNNKTHWRNKKRKRKFYKIASPESNTRTQTNQQKYKNKLKWKISN